MKRGVAALVGLVALATASTAQAAQRYAAPTGAGEACTQEAPCSLKQAIEKAKANDEVIVTAGSYSPASSMITVVENLNIHGDLGGPMPKISTSFGSSAPIQGVGAGDRLAYLEFSVTGTFPVGAVCGGGGRVERVRINAVGANAVGLRQSADCLARDSLIRVDGSESIALSASTYLGNWTSVSRNLTAIATGPKSIGVRALYEAFLIMSGTETADLKNVIASGEEFDLKAQQGFEGPGRIVVSNSNFDTVKQEGASTITDAGGNQTAPPLFLNAANGDYREAAGSPTIDAGSTDQIGSLDLDGSPRALGSAPDIGAFEFVPPPVPLAQIQSLQVAPKAFRAANVGGAVASRRKAKAPAGTTVSYSLSAKATPEFSVERKVLGRRVKGKCRKKTGANAGRKKCPIFKRIPNVFAHSGQAGQNAFRFSGRIGNKALAPGAYRLVGSAGGSVKRAAFKIVK
jgi:hypothetical protein